MKIHPLARLALGVFVVAALSAPAHADVGDVKCTMEFSIKGWSAFYKTAKGEGTISCDNGQRAEVKIRTKGGGLTFGKSEIVDGKGTFSGVRDISECFGAYAEAEAHAGAVKSTTARALTKGEVSLALAGKGGGVDLGISFGKFTITQVDGAPAGDERKGG